MCFSGLPFKNPGEIHDNPKSVRDSWEKTKIREPPRESERVGNYGICPFYCYCDKSSALILYHIYNEKI